MPTIVEAPRLWRQILSEHDRAESKTINDQDDL